MNLDVAKGNHYGVRHLLSPKSSRVSEAIRENLSLSEQRVQELLEFGSIYVNGVRCTKDIQISPETYIRVHQNPRRFPAKIFNFEKSLLFENDELLIIDKPSGLPVHPTVDNLHENILSLINAAREGSNSNPAVYVTHRLDVATSGLLILAKTKLAQAKINKLFADGIVKKIYRTFVHGQELPPLPKGELIHYMEPSPRAPKNVSPHAFPGWSLCKLKIIDHQPASISGNLEGLELTVELLTGRTHQIRAQMKAIGCPVVGDTAYGSTFVWPNSEGHEQIGLQCSYLSFPKNLESIQIQTEIQTDTQPKTPARTPSETEELMSFRLASRAWTLN